MRRGSVVVVAASGDFGKPRPAVIIESDTLSPTRPSVIVCQMTSAIAEASDFRVIVEASDGNGLRRRSQIMTDRPLTIRRTQVGATIGVLSAADMTRLNKALTVVMGLAD